MDLGRILNAVVCLVSIHNTKYGGQTNHVQYNGAVKRFNIWLYASQVGAVNVICSNARLLSNAVLSM